MSDTASPMTGTARIVLDESSSGPAEARVGDHVEVRLKAQFGTGFSWALSGSPPPALAPTAETIEPVEAPQPPEGGFETQVFSFDAVAPGEARLDFVYRRPWPVSYKHVRAPETQG
ncbi:MAG: protease inhibitor I42 family protein, partial [Rhodospirillaceae bacterium]|nr:protease inhibitor I42 family protein [Rhodospirillaceae bacterium]